MKKRMKAFVLAMLVAATAIMSVGCGSFDAASVVANYEKNVANTVKLTYVTNYKVDVVRPGADASLH